MKKLFIVSLVVFWGIVVALMAAALVIYETGKGSGEGNVSLTSNPASNFSGTLDTATIATHNTKNDCWLIIDGSAYDVTEYIPFHPGGEATIVSNCGQDASVAFATKGGRGQPHSAAATMLLQKYLVGKLGEVVGTATSTKESATSTNTTDQSPSQATAPVSKPTISEETTVIPASIPETSSALTVAGVAKHNTKNDCWLIISGKAYDVTAYIPFHPGGQNRIIDVCGTDATTLFSINSGGGHKHSTGAYTTLAKYLIGSVVAATSAVTDPNAPTCTTFTYSAWGICLADGTQLRTVASALPAGCSGGAPATVQSCTYTKPASPEQAYRDAIDAAYPGASITKLSLEDNGNAEFKFTWNGKTYEGKMNASYQITEME